VNLAQLHQSQKVLLCGPVRPNLEYFWKLVKQKPKVVVVMVIVVVVVVVVLVEVEVVVDYNTLYLLRKFSVLLHLASEKASSL